MISGKKMLSFTYPHPLSEDESIIECKNLSELYSVVSQLVKRYGGETLLEFDAGYNAINQYLLLPGEIEESDKQYFARIKKEEKQRIKQKAKYEELKALFEGEAVE